MDAVHKGPKRIATRGEGILWTAHLFPLCPDAIPMICDTPTISPQLPSQNSSVAHDHQIFPSPHNSTLDCMALSLFHSGAVDLMDRMGIEYNENDLDCKECGVASLCLVLRRVG